jgi:hypothetical protein
VSTIDPANPVLVIEGGASIDLGNIGAGGAKALIQQALKILFEPVVAVGSTDTYANYQFTCSVHSRRREI